MTEVFSRLVFMRHGESLWNKKGLFTGWVDVDLTENGINEIIMGAKELKKTNILFDSMHTSYLKRAIKTGNITLEIIDQLYIPIYQSWTLNERMYGNLQGLNKKDTVNKFGKDQVLKWRRSFDIPPPKIDKKNKYNPINEKKYKNIGTQNIPETESLKEVIARAQPYFDDVIMKELKNGKNILIAAHGNSIRAIVKYLDKIPNDVIPGLEIPTGIPLLYEFDKNMNIIKAQNAIPPLSGKFLGDPERIKKMQDKVKNQIKTDDNKESKQDTIQSMDDTLYKPSYNTGIFGTQLFGNKRVTESSYFKDGNDGRLSLNMVVQVTSDFEKFKSEISTLNIRYDINAGKSFINQVGIIKSINKDNNTIEIYVNTLSQIILIPVKAAFDPNNL